MPDTPTAKPLPPVLQNTLHHFFTHHLPREVGQQLRILLLGFLAIKFKTGIPFYLPELFDNMIALFDVLDTAARTIEAEARL